MRPAVRTVLLAALGGLCLAPAAFAQSYRGYSDRYSPPPPPPPPQAGEFIPPDDGYAGPTTSNSDGTVGYRPYVSHSDTTPDDPGRFAYDTERDRRVLQARGYDEDGAPPPSYARRTYPPSYGYAGQQYAPAYPSRYGDRYAQPYGAARPAAPAYSDDDEDDDAPPPPPRYTRPAYSGSYQGAPSYRGW